MNAPAETAALPKVRIATTSLAGCFGCHMSFLDIDERILDLMKIAEFDRSPITDIKHCGPCDIALIEGGVCNAENVQVLRELRANAKILVAIGACAITGGLPAMRNRLDIGDILNEVYRDLDGVQSHVPKVHHLQPCAGRRVSRPDLQIPPPVPAWRGRCGGRNLHGRGGRS